jgi:hypothetical protein
MQDLIEMFKQLVHYARVRKQWLIAMFIVFSLILGVLLAMSGAAYLAPFIYPFV